MFIYESMSRPKVIPARSHGGPIHCHDCGTTGYIEVYGPFSKDVCEHYVDDYEVGEYDLPPGWVMTWNWFRPLYTCPECGQARRDRIRRLLNLNIPR